MTGFAGFTGGLWEWPFYEDGLRRLGGSASSPEPFFNHGRSGNRFQAALAPKPFDPPVAHAPDKMILLSMILQTFPGCWSLMVSEACLVKVGDEHGNGGWFGWVSRFGY